MAVCAWWGLAVLLAAASPGTAGPDAGAAIDDGLNPADVAKVVRRGLGPIRACYERQLQLNPWRQGRTTAHWTITTEGAVTGVGWPRDDFADPLFTACLRSVIESWRFPRPNRPVEISFPFTFVADKQPPLPVPPAGQTSMPEDAARDWLNAVRRGDRAALSRLSRGSLALTGLRGDAGEPGAACHSPADLDPTLTCLLSDAGLRWALPKPTADGTWPGPGAPSTSYLQVVSAADAGDRLRRHRAIFPEGAQRVLVDAVIIGDKGSRLSVLLALEADGTTPPRVCAAAIDGRPPLPVPVSPDR